MESTVLPELSVVIPSYNEQATLPATVGQLVRILDGVAYEIVLVNNGSRDATAQVIDELKGKYGNIVRVDVQDNVGWGDGVIKGCAKARG